MKENQESNPTGKEIYEYKVESGLSWSRVGEHFGVSMDCAKYRGRSYYSQQGLPPPGGPVNGFSGARIIGSLQDEPKEDPEDLWKRAEALQLRHNKTIEYKASRKVLYDNGPVIIVWMGDLHLGSIGTDYIGLGSDITLIESLAEKGYQVGVVLLGDMLDNFIIGRLESLRKTQSVFTVIEEWGLVEYAIERLAPFLIAAGSGNHDNWSIALSGIDHLRERHLSLTPGILYDTHELSFGIQIGSNETRVMCRHKWKGSSMFNPTHGIEHKHHTMGKVFDIGVGGHTHRGGLAREMENGVRGVGHAIIVGTYKRTDPFASQIGFSPPLANASVATVIFGDGTLISTSSLSGLSQILK